MALPCVLFSTSSDQYKPDEFIKCILDLSELPEPHILNDAIKAYEWSFETKYYSTTIHLCTTNTRTIGSQEFADNLQAFVHYFNPNEPESFKMTKAWIPYLEHIEPTIQILVCKTSKHTDAINRKEALEWCISHGFELVELNPEEEEDDNDAEDDFFETTGMARIIQALHAHTWPNLELKDNPSVQSPYLRQLMKEQHALNQQEAAAGEESNTETTDQKCSQVAGVPCDSNTKTNGNVSGKLKEGKTDTNLNVNEKHEPNPTSDNAIGLDNMDWNALIGAQIQNTAGVDLNDQEMGVEEFEELFQKLKVMKDKAETLPPEERRKYAEKVAVSFWKAIGGDEDEIANLDESD